RSDLVSGRGQSFCTAAVFEAISCYGQRLASGVEYRRLSILLCTDSALQQSEARQNNRKSVADGSVCSLLKRAPIDISKEDSEQWDGCADGCVFTGYHSPAEQRGSRQTIVILGVE